MLMVFNGAPLVPLHYLTQHAREAAVDDVTRLCTLWGFAERDLLMADETVDRREADHGDAGHVSRHRFAGCHMLQQREGVSVEMGFRRGEGRVQRARVTVEDAL